MREATTEMLREAGMVNVPITPNALQPFGNNAMIDAASPGDET
jgi:hypothetical protein